MRDIPANELVPVGVLAIDTSTEQAGVSLSTENQVLSRSWPASRAQTTTVLPEIDRLVREANLTPADITALVVATGPGTFTGLRVGLAIAKGIVAAREVPMVGIPTLDIVFAMHPGEDIIAVLPAGRGRVVWQRTGAQPVNASLAEFIWASAGAQVVGELSESQRDEILAAGIDLRIERREPEVLLRIGASRIAAGQLDDATTLEPTYLHGITVAAGPVEDRLKK